jgi:hypothetical protein
VVALGCDELKYDGWLNQEIPISQSNDVPIVWLKLNTGERFAAALDSGSPVTVVDPDHAPFQLDKAELSLQDGLSLDATRFVFHQVEIYGIPLGRVGLDPGAEVHGVLGASILRHFSVALHLGSKPALTLKDQTPDNRQDLAMDCDLAPLLSGAAAKRCTADIPAIVGGGGAIEFGGEKRTLEPTRLVVPMCLQPAAFDPAVTQVADLNQASGVPATALVATGLGQSLIARSAYDRLRAQDNTIAESGTATLRLPFGDEQVGLTTIPRIALVSNEDADLGPCEELARRRRWLVSLGRTPPTADIERDSAAVASLQTPAETSFAIVADESPLFQALRQELRPLVPDVDVIVSGSILRYFELDLDYPHSRVLLRCACADSRAQGGCDVSYAAGCMVVPYCSADPASAASCAR